MDKTGLAVRFICGAHRAHAVRDTFGLKVDRDDGAMCDVGADGDPGSGLVLCE